jgi:hypothetical protein
MTHDTAPTLLLAALAVLAIALPASRGEALYETGAAHPRLVCTAAELEQVRARLGEGVEALAYRELLAKCDGYLDPNSGRYVDWQERRNPAWRNRNGATWLTKCFEELAWAGVLSGEQRYIQGAKYIVLTIIRERVIDGIGGTNYGQPYEGWLSQPLDAGHSSRSLAIFYDLLYDQLTEPERAEVRGYMGGTYLAYFYDYMRKLPEEPNYPGILGHNFALIGNSSAALMTLAMWGETGDPALEWAWLDLFMDGIRQYLDIGLGVDGDALEGAGYTSACLYYLNFPVEALRRAGGENLFAHPRLRKAMDYYLYEALPGGNYFNNTNDAFFHAHTCFFPLYAAIYERPELTWLWEHVTGRMTDPADLFSDGQNAAQPLLNYTILWHALAPPAKTPEAVGLPLSHLFSRRGLTCMRSGWGEEDCLLSFTAGGNPEVGHGQYDANHFALYRGNSALAGDSGYGGGQTEHHNGILFDGQGQQTKTTEGRIAAFQTGELASYACGRAADLYGNPALRKFDRHVYFIHDKRRPYAVIYDEMAAGPGEHTYTWLLQGINDTGFMISGEGMRFDLGGAYPLLVDENTNWQMQVVLFAAAPPAFAVDACQTKWSATAEIVEHPRLRAEVRTAGAPHLLAFLYPCRPGTPQPQVTRVADHALRIAWGDRVDLVAFGPAQTAEAKTEGLGFVRTPAGSPTEEQ